MLKFYVYAHFTKDTKELFYIGKGSNYRAYSKKNRNSYWNRIVAKHGFYVEILHTDLNERDAFYYEIQKIAVFKPRANISKGGEGPSGIKQTKERVYKRVFPNGVHCNIGRTHSKETKLKISNTKKVAGLITRQKKVFCILTGKIYNNIKLATFALNIKRTTLNAMLSGQSKNKTSIRYIEDMI